jgi:hypothetical protein
LNAALHVMEHSATFQVYDEAWDDASAGTIKTRAVRMRCDMMRHNILISKSDKHHSSILADRASATSDTSSHEQHHPIRQLIPLHCMSDVRDRPRDHYHRDTFSTPLPSFRIGYYPQTKSNPEGRFDYVNVSYLTVLSAEKTVVDAWRIGLTALIKWVVSFFLFFVCFLVATVAYVRLQLPLCHQQMIFFCAGTTH